MDAYLKFATYATRDDIPFFRKRQYFIALYTKRHLLVQKAAAKVRNNTNAFTYKEEAIMGLLYNQIVRDKPNDILNSGPISCITWTTFFGILQQ